MNVIKTQLKILFVDFLFTSLFFAINNVKLLNTIMKVLKKNSAGKLKSMVQSGLPLLTM